MPSETHTGDFFGPLWFTTWQLSGANVLHLVVISLNDVEFGNCVDLCASTRNSIFHRVKECSGLKAHLWWNLNKIHGTSFGLMHISRKSFILITWLCFWASSLDAIYRIITCKDLRLIWNYFCTHTLGGVVLTYFFVRLVCKNFSAHTQVSILLLTA